jgi:hypothetical protein
VAFFSADDEGVSGAQADGKRGRPFPHFRKSLYIFFKKVTFWGLILQNPTTWGTVL